MAETEIVYVVAARTRLGDAVVELQRGSDWSMQRFEAFESFLEARDIEQPGCLLIEHAFWSAEVPPCAVLQERADQIPFVVLLDSDDVRSAVDALQGGAFDVLPPDADMEAVAARLSSALRADQHRRQRREAVAQLRNDLGRLSKPARELVEWMCSQLAHLDRQLAGPNGVSPNGNHGSPNGANGSGHNGRQPAAPWFQELPPRLRETLHRLRNGYSEKQIAYELNLSPHTVHDYVKSLHKRLSVSSRGELLAKCFEDLGHEELE